jgi:hypothetical protein
VTVYGYRHYTPKTGQFLGRDPIQERGGMNLYGFVGNDGVDRWDLLGLVRKFYDSRGSFVGTDRKYIFWGDRKFIEGPNGKVEWCGKKYWEVWEHDEEYLPGVSVGVAENWEPKMKAFYLKNKGGWIDRKIPYAWILSLGRVLDNSPQEQPWDYKRYLERKQWYIFDDKAYRFDSIGNITWGAIMESHGWTETIALSGAGAIQLRDDYRNWKRNDLSLWELVSKNRSVFGDEERDTEAIKVGYEWVPDGWLRW